MYYANHTQNGSHWAAFHTAETAYEWLISEIGDEYRGDFWLEPGSYHISKSKRMFDFDVEIYFGRAEAVTSVLNLDALELADELRALASLFEMNRRYDP